MVKTAALRQSEIAAAKRLKISSIIVVIVLPLLIAMNVVLFKQKFYLLMSLLILIAVMLPFFMIFEGRRPKAREIVLIVSMSALTIAASLLCHAVLPFLQIGTALIIVSGVSLGPEAGFLIGALSRLIMNFYLGQGVWTPWQMFSCGVLGFLAGLMFNREDLLDSLATDRKKLATERNKCGEIRDEDLFADKYENVFIKIAKGIKSFAAPIMAVVFAEIAAYVSYMIVPDSSGRLLGIRMYIFGLAGLVIGIILQKKKINAGPLSMSLFTVITTFIIYGGIMNFATMCMSMNVPGSEGFSFNALRALYISGVPYDFSHAISAAICVFIFGKAIVNKLERIKVKYGIYR